MPDSVQVFPPGFRITDANGDPVSGAKLNFYDAGTTDQQTVYSDSGLATALPNPVICDSAGAPTSDGNAVTEIYVGTAAYKVVITDSSDVTLFTFDNIQGAVDTSSFGDGSGSGTYSRPVDSVTSDYSVVSGDAGKILNANPTGATFTLTLPSAVTVGDGFAVGVRHDGTANQVRIATVSGETIDVPGANAAGGYALTGLGHWAELLSDGANWILTVVTPALVTGDLPSITVVDLLTSPPSSPTAGARYIIESTPTGDWASFSEHDIVEADGQGGWISYTPPTDCGWLAYDQDSNTIYQFRASAWVSLNNITAPTESLLEYSVYQARKDNNTAADTPTASAWTAQSCTVEEFYTIGITATLPGSTIPVPTGSYLLVGKVSTGNVGSGRVRIYNSTDSAVVKQGLNETASGEYTATVITPLVVTEATENIQLQYYVGAANATTAVNTGEEEVYAELTIINLTSLQGPQGNQGAQGAAGADGANAGFSYTWDSDTSETDPGSGDVKGNDASLANITEIYISETDGDSTDLATEIATWDDAGAKIKIQGSAGMILFDVTSANVDNGSWVTLTGTVLASRGSLSGTVSVLPVLEGPVGQTGSTGSTGAAGVITLDYSWETSTSGDPGSGAIRVDNGTLASLTEFAVSETDRLGNGLAALWAALDNSDSTTSKLTVYIFDVSDATNFLILQCTSVLTDQGGYDTFTASHVASGGTLTDSQRVTVMPIPTGDRGSGLASVVDDTTPQLGGMLDVNGQSIGDGTRELLTFTEDASAVNHINIENEATGSGPIISAAGDDTDIDLLLAGKGTGVPKIGANAIIDAGDTASTSEAGIVELATADEYRGNDSADLAITVGKAWDAMAEVALTSSSNSVAWDMDGGIDFDIDTLGENTTIANPTNVIVGKKGRLRIVQDGTGSRTVSWGSNFEFAGGTAPTATTTASAEDIFYYDCISATRILITNVLDIS